MRDQDHRHFLKIRDGGTYLCAGTSGLRGVGGWLGGDRERPKKVDGLGARENPAGRKSLSGTRAQVGGLGF